MVMLLQFYVIEKETHALFHQNNQGMNTTILHHSGRQWPGPCDDERLFFMLRETLQEAARRSARSGGAVLASFTLPVERFDALHVFNGSELAGFGARFFWERQLENIAMLGIGAAVTIEASGTARFATTAAAWRAIAREAVSRCMPGALPAGSSGPVLLGGFAFDPLSPRTSLWEGFPDGLLIVPRLLLRSAPEGAALTVNTLVRSSNDTEYEAEQLAGDLGRMWAATEQAAPPRRQEATNGSYPLSAQDLLPAAEWMEQVASTVKLIRAGAFEKVVLARGLRVTSRAPFDTGAILGRLRDSYAGASVFAIQRGRRYFVGATPERLVHVRDGQIRTMALAGSAPRGASEEEDRRLGAQLLRSEKNKQEHAIVVERVREALATFCASVSAAQAPRLLRLTNIQHLETPIAGELLPGRSVLEALEALHPTPAVGGLPGPEALERIRDCEQLDRGWYAGPVGWVDANGNGEFAVALRSALLDGRQATLFAGCGIVADSDPQSEYDESCLKFQAMLRGLSGMSGMSGMSGKD